MTKMIEVNGEKRFEFKVRVEDAFGGRKTYSIYATTEYEARKAVTFQLGCGYKVIWVK